MREHFGAESLSRPDRRQRWTRTSDVRPIQSASSQRPPPASSCSRRGGSSLARGALKEAASAVK